MYPLFEDCYECYSFQFYGELCYTIEDHLKNLKGFLWKYGCGTDHLDSVRISEVDLGKVSRSELSELREVVPLLHDDIMHVHVDTQLGTNPWGLKDVTGCMDGQHSLLYDGRKSSADVSINEGAVFLSSFSRFTCCKCSSATLNALRWFTANSRPSNPRVWDRLH
ncbi:uncharacterized protein LOC132311286 [Cornus florida]|uniref:uncharacterized protein LOC132311286 n=1 Tax=Cornus florida TaxID=4283 RepID=UPI00289987A8|nr:uncharacterized protein LOC132311286 [Cornus florida]